MQIYVSLLLQLFEPFSTFSSEPPVIATPSTKSAYNEGTKVDVTCKVTGIPTPTVTWFREGRQKVYKTGEGSAALSFSYVNRNDAGQYRCKANNTAGTDETGALSLVVHCKYKLKRLIFICLNEERESCIILLSCNI